MEGLGHLRKHSGPGARGPWSPVLFIFLDHLLCADIFPKTSRGPCRSLQAKPTVFRIGHWGKVPEKKDLPQLTQSEGRGGRSPGPGFSSLSAPFRKARQEQSSLKPKRTRVLKPQLQT